MTPAIWYRHWLEIRLPVTIAGIAEAPLCLLLATAPLFPWAGPPRVWVAAYIGLSTFVVFGSLMLAGTGVRTIAASRHPSLHYTLTLPAARFTLLWTRFVVGAGSTAMLFAALLTAGATGMLATGRGVALGAMAATSIVAGLLAVALQAVAVLLTLRNERLAPWVFNAGVVTLLIAAPPFEPTPLAAMVMAGEAALWRVAWVLVLIVAASMCLAAVTVRRHDF